MSKSLYAIGGLGIGACIVLSMTMQHLLDVKQERDRSPLALELEAQLGGRRVGPVEVGEQRDGDKVSLVVGVRVLAGLQKPRIAEALAVLAWRHAETMVPVPHSVVVEVGDDDNGPATRLVVPRPRRPR